jgi:Outer membrane protein transport protein (OMPP1/FadL/TodX)
MVKTKKIALFLGLLCSFAAFAQNETDYYRFVDMRLQGSTRVQGMAGSFGALGADMSSSYINPAGLGRFSKNIFTLSLNQESVLSRALFQNEVTRAKDFNVKLSSIGGVFVKDVSRRSKGWNYRQIGFGYSRTASYESSMRYSGIQYESLLEVFANQAAGVAPEGLPANFPFTTNLAYYTYAIDPGLGLTYVPQLSAGNMQHERTVNQTGGSGEYYFSVSGNYSNRFLVGGTLNLRRVNYESVTTHTETLLDTVGVSLRSFEFTENLKQKGGAVSLRLGGIFLLNENFSLGFAAVTPSRLNISDTYSTNFVSQFKNTTISADSVSKTNKYNYSITTPLKITSSASYVNPRYGSINVDVDYLDYSSGKFTAVTDNYNFNPENKRINQDFATAINVRVGGEYILDAEYLLRAGYSYNGAIIKKGIAGPGVSNGVSFGFGIRKNNVKFDVSYSYLGGKYPYAAFVGSESKINFSRHLISIGIGF